MSTHLCIKEKNTVCGSCGDCNSSEIPPAEQPSTLSVFDALKALSMEQRLIYLLQTLARLQKSNLVKQHHPALTRGHMDENHQRQGAVKAYSDTSKFITSLFGDELRAVLLKKEEVH